MASLISFTFINSLSVIHFATLVFVYPKDSKASFRSSFINNNSGFEAFDVINLLDDISLISSIDSAKSSFFTLSFKSKIIFCAFFTPSPGTLVKIFDSFSFTMSIISRVLKVDNMAIPSLGPTPLIVINALKVLFHFGF